MMPIDNTDRRYMAIQMATGLALVVIIGITLSLIEGRVACLLAIYVEFVVVSTLGDVCAARDEPKSKVVARKMTMNAVLGVPACLLAMPFIG